MKKSLRRAPLLLAGLCLVVLIPPARAGVEGAAGVSADSAKAFAARVAGFTSERTTPGLAVSVYLDTIESHPDPVNRDSTIAASSVFAVEFDSILLPLYKSCKQPASARQFRALVDAKTGAFLEIRSMPLWTGTPSRETLWSTMASDDPWPGSPIVPRAIRTETSTSTPPVALLQALTVDSIMDLCSAKEIVAQLITLTFTKSSPPVRWATPDTTFTAWFIRIRDFDRPQMDTNDTEDMGVIGRFGSYLISAETGQLVTRLTGYTKRKQ